MAPFRIAILWRGDREARRTASAQNNRYHRIFEELSGLRHLPHILHEIWNHRRLARRIRRCRRTPPTVSIQTWPWISRSAPV